MKALLIISLALTLGIWYADAQQTSPPDLTPGIVAQAAYKGWLEAQVGSLWADAANKASEVASLQSITANVPQDEANITSLQNANSANASAIATMQAQILVMQKQIQILQQGTPPPPPPGAIYALAVSFTQDRANPVNLDGSTIRGNVFIYSSAFASLGNDNPTGVVSVSYWLDNVNMTSPAFHVENGAPWDFQGGTVTQAVPWNSATLPNGQHTLTQRVTFSNGAEVDTATFTVAN